MFSLLWRLRVLLIIWCLSCLVYLIAPYYQICWYFLHLTLISFNLLLRWLLFDNLASSSCFQILPSLSRHTEHIYSAVKFCYRSSNSFQHLVIIPRILKLCWLIKSCLFSDFRHNLCFLQLGSWGQHWQSAYIQYNTIIQIESGNSLKDPDPLILSSGCLKLVWNGNQEKYNMATPQSHSQQIPSRNLLFITPLREASSGCGHSVPTHQVPRSCVCISGTPVQIYTGHLHMCLSIWAESVPPGWLLVSHVMFPCTHSHIVLVCSKHK